MCGVKALRKGVHYDTADNSAQDGRLLAGDVY